VPVDGGWSLWTEWSSCSVACGTGTEQRSHMCTNPTPAHGGAYCNGDELESKDCEGSCQCKCIVKGMYVVLYCIKPTSL